MTGLSITDGEPQDGTMSTAHTDRTPLLPSKRQDLVVEDVYDDYHEASVPSAIFNLSTTIVGAGIMALPATMKVMGLPLGILTIIVMGILSENSIQIMLRYSRPSGARSYGGLMADAFGGIGRTLVQLCIIINNIGILIVYLIIIGKSSALISRNSFFQLLSGTSNKLQGMKHFNRPWSMYFIIIVKNLDDFFAIDSVSKRNRTYDQ